MTGLRTRNGLGIGHGLSIKHPDGTWKPLGTYPPRTNLFTNPAFTATRTPLVVARNYFPNPVLGNATPDLNWGHAAGGATVVASVVGSGGVDPTVPFRRMHFNTDSTATGSFGPYFGSPSSNVIPATAGLVYSGSVYVRHNLAVARDFTFYIQFYNASNTVTNSFTRGFTVQPNTWTQIKLDNVLAPANSVRIFCLAYVVGAVGGNNGPITAGSNIDMTMPNVDQSPGIQEFFSGASTGTDYVYAWTGAAHASASTKSAGAVVATNLCTNPGAETAANGWLANSGAISTADRDTTVKHSGTQSCRGTNVSGGTDLLSIYNAGYGAGPSGYTPVTVGRWYAGSIWFYTNETSASQRIQIRYTDGAFASVGSTYSTLTALTPGVWTKATVSAAAPTGAVYVHLLAYVTKTGATAGMNAWCDDACLQEGVGTDTFDGNVSTTNLMSVPGADGATYWNTNNSAWATVARDTLVKRSGTQSCRSTSVSLTYLLTIYNAGGPPVAVTVGRWYAFSCWLMTYESNASGGVSIVFLDSGGANINPVYSTTPPVALTPGVWTKATISAMAPANAVTVRTGATITKSDAAAGMQAWADDATLTAGTEIYDPDFVYAWTGTPEASTSVKMAKKLATATSGNSQPVASSMWSGHPQSMRLWSLYAVSNGSGYGDIANDVSAVFLSSPLQRGVTYRISVTAYVDPAYPVPAGAVPGLNYSESGTGVSVSDNVPVGAFGERQLSLTFTPTVDASNTSFRLRFYNGGYEGAFSVWFDNIVVETNPPLGVLDGPKLSQNLEPNPSFATDATWYTAFVGTAISRDTSVYHSSPASMATVFTPGTYSPATYGPSMYANPIGVSLPVGTLLRWSVWLKASKTVTMTIWPTLNSNLLSSAGPRVNDITITTDWQEFVIEWASDRATTNMYFILGRTDLTSGDPFTVWMDDVFVGTRAYQYDLGKNALANSSFWANSTGWQNLKGTSVGRDLTVYRTGPASLLTTLTPGSYPPYGATMYCVAQALSAPVGTPIRWSAWMRAARTVSMQIWPLVNNVVMTALKKEITVTTVWQEFVIEWVADTPVTTINAYFGSNTEATPFQFWTDDVFIGTRNPAYFDGNTIDTNDYQYNWTGTADASTSTATAP